MPAIRSAPLRGRRLWHGGGKLRGTQRNVASAATSTVALTLGSFLIGVMAWTVLIGVMACYGFWIDQGHRLWGCLTAAQQRSSQRLEGFQKRTQKSSLNGRPRSKKCQFKAPTKGTLSGTLERVP